MAAHQICVRCRNTWPVTYQPRQWCPSCHGLLLSPTDAHRPVPPNRRNFRWVAQSPGQAAQIPQPPTAPSPSRPGEPPAYTSVPQWGLHDVRSADDDESRTAETLADLAPTLLVGAAVIFGLAALAELGRYWMLLVNRTRLVEPVVLAISDSAVWATQIAGPLVGLAAVVASAVRLIEVRRRAFAARGLSDPRPPVLLLAGTVLPVVNLAMPGVFLTEAAGENVRLRRAVRLWWVLFVVNAAMVMITLLWRLRDSLQARADAVLLTAVTVALASAVAVATLYVLRLFDGTDLRGRTLNYRRLTPATIPADTPIAPITPRLDTPADEVRDEPVGVAS